MAVSKKDDRAKALELTRAQIEKQFGKGAIMRMSKDVRVDVSAISNGVHFFRKLVKGPIIILNLDF